MRNQFIHNTKHWLVIIIVLFITIPAKANLAKEKTKETSISYKARLNLPAVLNESSGLMFWDDRLWSHNDSGGNDSIYAFLPSNPSNVVSYWSGARNRDWEAIEQDDDNIYIGDFGNNATGNRTNLRIFKINKKSLLERKPVVDTIFFSFSEQTDFSPTLRPESTDWDCEAFIVATDSIYLFTKQWNNNKTTLYTLPKTPGTYYTRYITTYDIKGLVTDAVYLPTKRILALSGYSVNYLKQFLYVFYDFEERDFFSGKKHKFILNVGIVPHQIEGVATLDGRIYYFTNEYKSVSPQRLHVFDVNKYFEDYLRLPETAISINGPDRVCSSNPYATYSVSPIENASSYEWILPDGVTGESNTNTISVHFDTDTFNKIISVRAINEYGYGGKTTIQIMIVPPPNPATITIADYENKILRSSYSSGNQWYNRDNLIHGATFQYFEVKEYGEYYVRVSSNGCFSNPSNVIATGRKLDLYNPLLFEIESISNKENPQPLHDYIKNTPKKKKRKFLFWDFSQKSHSHL